MINKLIKYLKYRFTPGITIVILAGDVQILDEFGYKTYSRYMLHLNENEYGRKYFSYESIDYSFKRFKKKSNTYAIAVQWVNGVKYKEFPSYSEIKNNEKNVYLHELYWPKD